LQAGEQPVAPHPTPPETAGRILSPNETHLTVSGRASPEAHAVGLQIAEQGTGYWVLPLGSPDPVNKNQLTWRASVDFGPSLPAGLHHLRVAAWDENGRAGTQQQVELCLRSAIPDNLNACIPSREPPNLVVSLEWQSAADLDLRVFGSDGSELSQRNTLTEDGDPTLGRFESDANAGCAASGKARENAVWDERPKPGVYYVYVNLYDPCGQAAIPFVVTTHVAKRDGDEFRQVETFRVASELLNLHAKPEARRGLFVTEFEVK
jgi:hypothetical protein